MGEQNRFVVSDYCTQLFKVFFSNLLLHCDLTNKCMKENHLPETNNYATI